MPLFTPNAADALFSGFSGVTIFDQGPAGNDGAVFAATFYKPIQDEVLNLIQIVINGGLAIRVTNDTGISLPAGPITVSGYDAGAGAWKAIKADAQGPNAKAALFLLLTALPNGSTRNVYAQGEVLGTDSGFSTLGATAGDPVYLADGGGFSLTAPSVTDLTQIVGAVLSVANPGNVLGFIRPIEVPIIGFSGFSGFSGFGQSGYSGKSGYSGVIGQSGTSGFSGADSGYSGYSGSSGYTGFSGYTGVSGYSGESASGGTGLSGFSGNSGYSGQSANAKDGVAQGFMERTHYLAQSSGFSSSATTLKYIIEGAGGSYSSFGSVVKSEPDFGNGFQFSSTASSGSTAGIVGASGAGNAVALANWHPIFTATIWTGVNTNDITNLRLYIGLVQVAKFPDTTDTVGTLQAINMLAFRYDSTGGVDAAGQWSAVTCDGSTLNVITSIGSIALDTAYRLRIDTWTTPGTAVFYINDVQVASTSSNLPSSNIQLLPFARATSTDSTASSFAWKKFQISID